MHHGQETLRKFQAGGSYKSSERKGADPLSYRRTCSSLLPEKTTSSSLGLRGSKRMLGMQTHGVPPAKRQASSQFNPGDPAQGLKGKASLDHKTTEIAPKVLSKVGLADGRKGEVSISTSARTWPIFFYCYIVPNDDRLSIKNDNLET